MYNMHQTYKYDDDDQLDYTFGGDDDYEKSIEKYDEWEDGDDVNGYEEYDRYDDTEVSDED